LSFEALGLEPSLLPCATPSDPVKIIDLDLNYSDFSLRDGLVTLKAESAFY